MSEPVVLGIESTCDETAAAIVRGRELLSNVVASSMEEHARYGGVIPEIASRAHAEAFVPCVSKALVDANMTLADVDAIAVSAGPGLAGCLAVGVSGSDAGTLIAEPLDPELGRVGKVTHVNTDYIERLLDSEYIPVIATVAAGEDGGFFNINADTAAGAVAAALHAHKAIFLTDVDGLYKDFSDKDSLISNLTLDEVNEMLYGGEVDKGMIPKLRAAVDALTAGVFRAHIINGTTPHSLLLELLTDAGVGTVIHSTETAYEFDTHPHPLSTFAARLAENLDEVEKLQTV